MIIAKVRSLPTFLGRNFLSNEFGLSTVVVSMDATGFPSLRKKQFFPETTSQ